MFYYKLSERLCMRCIVLLGMLAALSGYATDVLAAEPLPPPKGQVLLVVSGRIEQTNVSGEAHFDREMLAALGERSIRTGSALTDGTQLFEGVPLRAVLDRVGAKGRSLKASALNDYEVAIPWDDLRYNPLIAMKVDGQLLKLRDKGPLWIVYPRDDYAVLKAESYDSRWVWQLNKLHVE
jgi:hypothetical protein